MNENQKLGTIMKELIRFSLPLILSGVLQQLYNWADAFIVGNVDGELSLSAIGVTSIPISFFITTITGFTLGLSVLIAKNFGAKKQDSIPPVLAVFAVILGGVFLLALLMNVNFASSQLSPTHICTAIISDYFGVTFFATVKKLLPLFLLTVLIACGYYMLLTAVF